MEKIEFEFFVYQARLAIDSVLKRSGFLDYYAFEPDRLYWLVSSVHSDVLRRLDDSPGWDSVEG